jgi:TATA-binding protein-associated factor Taf7
MKKNTRLKSALDLLKEKTQEAKENDTELNLSENDDDDNTPIPQKTPPKKRKRTQNTKLMNDVLTVTEKTKRRSRKKAAIPAPILSDEDTF